jgi:curved DNA-binding protein CbpA
LCLFVAMVGLAGERFCTSSTPPRWILAPTEMPGKPKDIPMANRPESESYYAILGVARTASFDEIRAAFRERAKELHPDRNQQRNTKEDFQRIREAYVVLGNAEKRRAYDFSERAVTMDASGWAPAAAPVSPLPPRQKYRSVAVAIPLLALAVLAYGIFAWITHESPAPPPTAWDIEADVSRHRLTFTGVPPEPASFEVMGKEGKKHIVMAVDYKRLRPIHDRLASESSDLQRRKTDMDARRADLEKEQRTLAPSNVVAVLDFRRKVDAFNADGAALRRHLEVHAAEVEEYFKEVERLAVSGR